MSGNIDAGSKSLKLDYEAKTTTVFLLNNNNNLMSLHAGLVQRYSVSDLTLTGLPLLEIQGERREPMNNSASTCCHYPKYFARGTTCPAAHPIEPSDHLL